VNVCPTCAVPVIVGGDWFVGAALFAADESPVTASTVTTPAASRASNEVVFFIRWSPLLSELHVMCPPFRKKE
jgi:hypothetical protein